MEAEANAPASLTPLRFYSAGGVKLLSLLFTTIVGGVMAAQNLKAINQRQAARLVLWGSIGYTLATFYLTTLLPKSPATPWFSWPIGLIGGLGVEAYSRRFMPDWHTVPVKSNFKPIVICLTIFGLFFGALLYALSVAANLRHE